MELDGKHTPNAQTLQKVSKTKRYIPFQRNSAKESGAAAGNSNPLNCQVHDSYITNPNVSKNNQTYADQFWARRIGNKELKTSRWKKRVVQNPRTFGSSDSAASTYLFYFITNEEGTKLKNLLPDEGILKPRTPENTIKNNSIKEESSVKSSTLFSDFTRLTM